MFTIEQINDLHARLGSARTLPEYVLALKGLGVERYDSYLADGHSEYFGQGGHRVVSPPVHEVLPVAETVIFERATPKARFKAMRRRTILQMNNLPAGPRSEFSSLQARIPAFALFLGYNCRRRLRKPSKGLMVTRRV
jgi:hypothetical protein